MTTFILFKLSKLKQFFFSILILVVIGFFCHSISAYAGKEVIGFILLIAVLLLAFMFDTEPVLISAVLTAVIWDFFFIEPVRAFKIPNSEDLVFLIMYISVALLQALLLFKFRQQEKTAPRRDGKANAIKLYNTLLNSLSHELRTPIATIIAATDNLQNNRENLNVVQQDELVNEISKASFRLNHQVDNLLNMSRIDSGVIQPKNDWCDITELIHDVVNKIQEGYVAQKICININPSIPLFKLDKGMLEQVVYNILNNAVIYTEPHCRIDITAICHVDVLHIIIEDDGKGFPHDEMDKVFDKFYRLKNSKTGGTGLGLSIVKGFVDAMQGTISLENKANGGAKFIIGITAETSYLKNLKNE